MPDVKQIFSKMAKMHKNCLCCTKPATYYVDVIPGKTKRPLYLCDRCMSRNQHLLFNAYRENDNSYVTYLRRKKHEDLPDLMKKKK